MSSVASTSTREKKNLVWTTIMDNFFIEKMIEQCLKGRKGEGGFTTTAWIELVLSFQNKFPHLGLKKEKLRSRLRAIKKRYSIVKEMVVQSGFSWNSSTNTIEVSKEVWEPYIQAHPEARQFRFFEYGEYEKLAMIFGDTIAEGRDARTLEDLDTIDEIPATNLDETKISTTHVHDEPTSPKAPPTIETRRKKSRLDDSNTRIPRGCRSATDGFLQAIAYFAAAIREKDNKPDPLLVQCEKALGALGELDDEFYIAALDLFSDRRFASAFLVQPSLALMVPLKDIVPAATNTVNTQFILLAKGCTIRDGKEMTCLVLVADESASVHFQMWGSECEAFEPGDIIRLSSGIFSYHKNNLVLRAGKRGTVEKVGEFTMLFVETPNMSEIRWGRDPNNPKKFVQEEVVSPHSQIFPPMA